jgi:hypothetical protein
MTEPYGFPGTNSVVHHFGSSCRIESCPKCRRYLAWRPASTHHGGCRSGERVRNRPGAEPFRADRRAPTTCNFRVDCGRSCGAGRVRTFPTSRSGHHRHRFGGICGQPASQRLFPTPWQGSPNTVFIGGGTSFDAGAIRLDNPTDVPLPVDSVTVDLQRPGPAFNLWGTFTIPARGSAVLTQTAEFNFDTSDFPIEPCGTVTPAGDPRIPQVTISIGGQTTSLLDTGRVLDTNGYDLACQSANESLSGGRSAARRPAPPAGRSPSRRPPRPAPPGRRPR